jgi:uncharacterized membrane protein YdjX (TVP38/TMEM64 family)
LLESWIDGLGIWAPLGFGAAYVVATLLLLPGSVLTLLAGATFGFWNALVIVSVSSTTTAALAFLIARFLARDAVKRRVERSDRLAAIDEAIGQHGWRLVALLRLAPVVPFNLQNYLYGVTAIRFWPAVIASWIAMLPGTVVYVYLGTLGRAFASGGEASRPEWALRILGLAASIAATVYITRIARRAINARTNFDRGATGSETVVREPSATVRVEGARTWSVVLPVAGVALLAVALLAYVRRDEIGEWLDRQLGLPPAVRSSEAYDRSAGGASFDHSEFDRLLRDHVDRNGFVDYDSLRAHPGALARYRTQLAAAPFDALTRDEKLALLINAYNAFTLTLIAEHYPIDSILDIPESKRWKDVRWRVGGRLWSLDQIEHEEIRPKFVEPRIHFSLVCAAVSCPPLRNEAYRASGLESQLEAQALYVHNQPRWLQLDAETGVVHLTPLYDWYGGDFTQSGQSVLDYAARYSQPLHRLMTSGRRPRVRFLPYDWRLNDRSHRLTPIGRRLFQQPPGSSEHQPDTAADLQSAGAQLDPSRRRCC